MTANLTLEQCTDNRTWDAFVQNSPQGNIFCRTPFLAALDTQADRWFVIQHGQQQVAAIVLKRGQRVVSAPHPFTLYQGVLLSPALTSLPAHELFRRLPELLDFMLQRLARRYRQVSLCLHHTFPDLRGIQWFNHHQPEHGLFSIALRYTGLIDVAAHVTFEQYLAKIRPKNRQHNRTALRVGLISEQSKDIATLDRLHSLTFRRQGLRCSPREQQLLRTITAAALAHGFGQLLVCRDQTGTALAATLFLYDERCGYSLFAGNNPDRRREQGGTLLLLENIRECFSRNLKWVDLCGINSPQRGDFKTSFNALPAPFFVASWQPPRP